MVGCLYFTISEHNEPKTAQIWKFHCLSGNFSSKIMFKDCVFATKHMPAASETLRECFTNVQTSISDTYIHDFHNIWEMDNGCGWGMVLIFKLTLHIVLTLAGSVVLHQPVRQKLSTIPKTVAELCSCSKALFKHH